MSPEIRKSFTAVLEPDGTRLRWVIARVPFDIAKAWPVRRGRRVRGTIEGFAFRTSLFPDPSGAGLVLLVNKSMQAAARARVGAKVRFALEPDLEEREVAIPSEMERVLNADRGLNRWFGKLSPSMRREIGKWVAAPKSAETRTKRAEKMAERLLQAMEGESDPPPILKAAFQRQPQAKVAWEALTVTQRRNHLLGIFHYETVEGRERRTEKVIDDVLARMKTTVRAKRRADIGE
jgi:uncharacterized protein YdeI (YjbR/CyaY-like superfamily)